jgi:ABC-2 type transport system permease protein
LRFPVVYAFSAYEIKRAVARRKVLVLVAFVLLLDILPYYALASSSVASIIPASLYPYVWIAGILVPQPLFIPFLSIFIAAGAMSEEYEQGTAELLLSKPVSRMEYVVGKFLGGYILLLLILLLSTLVSLASAYLSFGAQASLNVLPGAYLVTAFSSLLFFSVSFMVGELMRRSSLAYIFSSALLFASTIISVYLGFIYELTGNAFYQTVRLYLPTSPVSSLPTQYFSSTLASTVTTLFNALPIGSSVEPSMLYSVLLILAYAVPSILIFLFCFRYADVSRRVS